MRVQTLKILFDLTNLKVMPSKKLCLLCGLSTKKRRVQIETGCVASVTLCVILCGTALPKQHTASVCTLLLFLSGRHQEEFWYE